MSRDAETPTLRETLRVVAVEGGQVRLSGDRASACAACSARAGCGAGALAGLIGGRHELRVDRGLPVAVGEEVTVAMSRGAFLGAVLRAYLLPCLALVSVALASAFLDLSDIVTALLCFPALALAVLPLRRAERRERANSALWLEPSGD